MNSDGHVPKMGHMRKYIFSRGKALLWICNRRQFNGVRCQQPAAAHGQRNENASITYLKNFYGDDWSVISTGEPGIRKDALTGVDMSMVNSTTGE